jgi:hypothetical protein
MTDDGSLTDRLDKDEPDYSQIPSDFPRPEMLGAVSGFQPKLLLESYAGKYYALGCTPPDLYSQWDRCEDLAKQLAAKSMESKHGKRSEMSELAILEQYLPRLIATGWTSEAEARFIIRRAAALLDWPVPPTAEG